MGKAYRKMSEKMYLPKQDSDVRRFREAENKRRYLERVPCSTCKTLVPRWQAKKRKVRGRPREYWCQQCAREGRAPKETL